MFEELHYQYIIVVIVLLGLFCLYRLYSYDRPAININFSFVKKIFPEGRYQWQSEIGPTELYSKGLIRRGTAIITQNIEEKSVTITTKYNLINKIGNKSIMKCEGITKYYYKPDHGNNLFRKSVTYSGNKEVHTTYGYAIRKANNGFTFKISSATQYSKVELNQLEGTIRKLPNGIIHFGWENHNIFGFTNFTAVGEYKLIK